MEFDAEEIAAIRVIAAGALDEEIQRYLSVRNDVEVKLQALGGLTEAQANISRAKSMLAQAAHDAEKAKAVLAEAKCSAAKESQETQADRIEARKLLESTRAGAARSAIERQQLEDAKQKFELYKNRESDALATLARDLKEKEHTLAEGRKDLAEKIAKMKQMI